MNGFEPGWVLCGVPARGKYHWPGPDGRSLCGKWFIFDYQPREQGNDNSPDNCAECRRRREKAAAR
jgi:hypothetical protein